MTEDEFLEYVSRYSRFGEKSPIRTKQGFLVHCPAHEDRTPSLHISLMENGKVLHHCFAGCPWEQIERVSNELKMYLSIPQHTEPLVRHSMGIRFGKSRSAANPSWAGDFDCNILQAGWPDPECRADWDPEKEKAFLEELAPKLYWTGRTGTRMIPQRIWPYESPNEPGLFKFLVVRYQAPNHKKIIRPWSATRSRNNRLILKPFWCPIPRVLYRARALEEYLQEFRRPKVIITEGEKSADAAQYLFQDCFATTWAAGTGRWNETDLTCLHAHKPELLFWPDNDLSSMKSMQNISLQIGLRKSRFPDFVGLLTQNTDTPQTQGWDAADALEQGWTPEKVNKQRRGLERGNSLKIR